MLNYQSRFSRTKNPKDIPSLSKLVNAEIIRASSTDSANHSHSDLSKSKQLHLRNKSVQQQFSPLRNYKKIMRKYYNEEQEKIHDINQKMDQLKLKFQQAQKHGNYHMKRKEKIVFQTGPLVTPDSSKNSASKPSGKINQLQQQDRSESVQAQDTLKPMQKNKYSLKHIIIQEDHVISKSSSQQKPTKVFKGKYSQAKVESKKQQSQDSLQYVNDYRQYANASKHNIVKDSPISVLRKAEYARSQSQRVRKQSADYNQNYDDLTENLVLNQQSTVLAQMQDAKDSEKYDNENENSEYKLSKNVSNRNHLSSQQSLNKRQQKYYQESEESKLDEQDQNHSKESQKEVEAGVMKAKQNSNQIDDTERQDIEQRKISKPSFNFLSNPVIYQSHIESENSIIANSRPVQSGKKPTFKQLVKMRQLNPRLVTSTILNQKNGLNQGVPVKKNFKNLLKSNFNNILMKQKQKNINQIKESDSPTQFRDQNKQKKKSLLKAFFLQNLQ